MLGRGPRGVKVNPESLSDASTFPRSPATPEDTSAPGPSIAWWAAAVAFAAGFLTYANTLGHAFVWDDLILLDRKIRFYESARDVLFEPSGLPGLRVYRPLTFGSYWLDQLMWVRDPLGFHLTCVLLHALNCALVYALGCALRFGPAPALLAALVFAVHPVHSEAVTWVACRADLLVTTFAILAVLAFLRYCRRDGWATLAGIAVCTFGAIASKETGIALPLLLLAAVSTAPGESMAWLRPRRRSMAAILAAVAGVIVYWMLRPTDRSPGLSLSAFDLTGLRHLLGTFGFYVERTLLPLDVATYVPEPPGGAWESISAVAGMLAVAFLLVPRESPGSHRRFLTLWFLLTLAPALLVAIAEMLVTKASDRYLYLPSVGLALLLASWLSRHRELLGGRALRVATVTVLAGLAVVTITRNRVWRDEIAFWSGVTATETRFTVPYMNLGLALSEADRKPEAEEAYRLALAARGNDTNRRDTLINLGHLKRDEGELAEADRLFGEAIAIAPHPSAYYGLGSVAQKRARALSGEARNAEAAVELARAKAALETALAINPRHYQSHSVLASVLYLSGDFEAALEHYRRVVDLAGDTETGRDAAVSVQQLGDWLADPANRAALKERSGG